MNAAEIAISGGRIEIILGVPAIAPSPARSAITIEATSNAMIDSQRFVSIF